MRKILLSFLLLVSFALVSCTKECTYFVDYTDNTTAFANVTIFEYTYSGDLLAKREIKDIAHQVYEFSSFDGADFLVVGVEGIVGNRIIEWYCSERFVLDTKNPITIDVNFIKMNTQDTNPYNPDHHISRYLY